MDDTPTADEVSQALRDLAEGIPGSNEGQPSGTGELDNPQVRHLLAGAAFIAVRWTEPRDAFDALSPHLDPVQVAGWFGRKRAELILEMLGYQAGRVGESTWNSRRRTSLNEAGTRPDPRWAAVCARVSRESPELSYEADALGALLASPRAPSLR